LSGGSIIYETAAGGNPRPALAPGRRLG